MSTNRWIESETHKFVELYVQHACLFNVKCPEYKNKQARDAALQTIAAEMHHENFGVKEAYAKIRTLRSTYSQELKKIKASTRSGAGGNIYVPHMSWFKVLDDALGAINVECRNTQSNLESSSDQSQTCDDNGIQQLEGSSQHQSKTTEEFVAPTPTAATRKKRLRELQSLVDKVDKITKTANSPNLENEFDIFGKSVASQLKAMPLSLALRAQQQIQNVLCDLRIQQLINISSPTQSISRNNSPYFSSDYSQSPTPHHPIAFPAASPSYQPSPTDNNIASPAAPPTYQPSPNENCIASPAVSPNNQIHSPSETYEYVISESENSESQNNAITLYTSNYEEAVALAVSSMSQ